MKGGVSEEEFAKLKKEVEELRIKLKICRQEEEEEDYFPTEAELFDMSKTELDSLLNDTYTAWIRGSATVEHEELERRIGAIVNAMKRDR
jgi:hypothetical protein